MTNLVIVESPAKAKTIEKYLGKDFSVISSFGHIRDLDKKGMGIDIENNFTPMYSVSPGSTKHVSAIKKQLKKSETVWLATDEDREGEAIAWHLYDELKLTDSNTRRITFNEITKEAILHAVAHPRMIDLDLVNAQQARRVIDRLVGFKLSPVLWKKIQRGLSAGRVQSVAVRLVVEKERKIQQFQSVSNFQIEANLKSGSEEMKAHYPDTIDSKEAILPFFNQIQSTQWTVGKINRKVSKRSPQPPFTTSSLQQTASSMFGFSVKKTMVLAQKLYEAGYITYMRTDSVTLSSQAHEQIKKGIFKRFGDEYYQHRLYKTKQGNAQEAHEAIRPTDFDFDMKTGDSGEKKLYRLILERTLASQMSDAKINRTEINIDAGAEKPFICKGEEVVFDGFMHLTGRGSKNIILPSLKQGDHLQMQSVQARERFSRPSARYSEATLVKALEELGIGRPSTYAPTISTIQERGYVEVRDLEAQSREIQIIELSGEGISETVENEKFGSEQARMIPTAVAELVTDFLIEHAESIVDVQFTAKLEAKFDKIASGKESWGNMVSNFYSTFHPMVDHASQAQRPSETTARLIGTHPQLEKPLYAKIGRYGPYVQVGENPTDEEPSEKPLYASLRKNQNINTISLEEALKLFDLPRELGTLDKDIHHVAIDGSTFNAEKGITIYANIGRFGPYLQYGTRSYASLKKDHPSPEEITLERATEIIDEKLAADAKKHIAVYGDIYAMKGPYGFYLKQGRKNFKISQDMDPQNLSAQDIEKILTQTRKKGRKK